MIGEWVLILTLLGPYQRDPRALANIDGFATLKACATAGDAWLKQMSQVPDASWSRALCVRRSEG